MDKNIQRYNQGAQELAKKFNSIGARTDDVKRAFSYISKNKDIKVLELGCGNGRDAKEILKRTNDYLGIDVSEEMIKLAQQALPNANFIIADILNYPFPSNIDIIFAFASLLHLDKQQFEQILTKAHQSIAKEGIFYISTKYGEYEQKQKEDELGSSTYYLYIIEDITELANSMYEVVYSDTQEIKGVKWLTIALRKRG